MEGIVALLIPICICVVLPVLIVWLTARSNIRTTQMKMDVLMKAIETGQEIDPELLADFKHKKDNRSVKERLLGKLQGGAICGLIGAGIVVASFFVGEIAQWLIMGGVLLLCVGLGLLFSFFYGRKFLATEIAEEERKVSGQKSDESAAL